MNKLFFKIDTVGKVKNFTELTILEQNLFKTYIETKKKEAFEQLLTNTTNWQELWENHASLTPEFCKIITIAIKTKNGVVVLQNDDEKALLERLNNTINKRNDDKTKDPVLNTITLSFFDVNILISRMRFNDIRPNNLLDQSEKVIWYRTNKTIINLYQSITGNYTSFDLIAYAYNEDVSELLDGSLINKYYYEGKLDEIKKASKKKLEIIINIYNKLFFK